MHRPASLSRPAGRLFLLLLAAAGALCGPRFAAQAQPAAGERPEAYLRFEPEDGSAAPQYYVEVYMKQRLAAGATLADVRATLRDLGEGTLISATVAPSQEPGGSNFRIRVTADEAAILEHRPDYVVFVDAYPTDDGAVNAQVAVRLDVELKTEDVNPGACRPPFLPVPFTLTRKTNFPYATRRMQALNNFLKEPGAGASAAATVSTGPGHSEARTVRVSPPRADSGFNIISFCVELLQPPPDGDYTLELNFNTPAPFELRQTSLGTALTAATGGAVDAQAAERALEDNLDLGVVLTSSVDDQEQEDGSVERVRTNSGTLDLWFAPLLNVREVRGRRRGGGWVNFYTPGYIDAKVSTGKVTEETLSVNRIVLGSEFEFRRYFLPTDGYANLLRFIPSLKHTSDRDFKQAEVKFTFEFQPIWAAVNRPIGSRPNLVGDEIVENTDDKFGVELVPLVGFELGRVHRVRDPAQFADTSRTLRRFYFGGEFSVNFTRFVRLSAHDLFYVRGERSEDRAKNYFSGTVEALLDPISNRQAAHALFLSFERGEQPPFTSPSANVLKFGYRVRARGFFDRFR